MSVDWTRASGQEVVKAFPNTENYCIYEEFSTDQIYTLNRNTCARDCHELRGLQS